FVFFQAEDGIRDATVTGVQTCALPIYRRGALGTGGRGDEARLRRLRRVDRRSEERRVGKGVDLGGRRIIKKKNNVKQNKKQIIYTIQDEIHGSVHHPSPA